MGLVISCNVNIVRNKININAKFYKKNSKKINEVSRIVSFKIYKKRNVGTCALE